MVFGPYRARQDGTNIGVHVLQRAEPKKRPGDTERTFLEHGTQGFRRGPV
jgi:hypothetical protein